MKNNKTLIIGDLHFSSRLSYSSQIENGRCKEKKEILDFIVKQSIDCSSIVILGDLLDLITNPPQVIKDLTNFIERFNNKEIYIISGNHEKKANGETALDYLKEIKNHKWHIITRDIQQFNLQSNVATFLPYLTKPELSAKTNEEALQKVLEMLKPSDILFHHHTMIFNNKVVGIPPGIEISPEFILPVEELLKKYNLIIGGHIHTPSRNNNVITAGSIFTKEINEKEKYIWKIDCNLKGQKLIDSIEQIKLPGRYIYGITNPIKSQLDNIPKNSIVKITLTKKIPVVEIEKLKDKLKKFDAFMLIEKIPKTKKKLHYGKGETIINFNIEKLLKLYSKEKKVDYKMLKHGFDLINY